MTEPSLQKILYVEDDSDIQKIARLSLESIGGFQIEICGTGVEALHRYPSFRPDLILLDAMLPGMDGPGTLRAMRDLPEWTGTPVIFMTASTRHHEIEQFKRMGAVEVIPKPFDPMTLADTIRLIWVRHHSQS
jgi:CheY-like chemotaxis protein